MNLMDGIMIVSVIGWMIGSGYLLTMMIKGKSKIRPKVVR